MAESYGNVSSQESIPESEKIDLFAMLRQVLKGMRTLWWLPFVLALLAGIWHFAHIDRSYTPYYETSVTVYVQMSDGENGSYQNRLTAEQMVTFFPYLMQNGVLSDAIMTNMCTDSLPGSISVTVSPYTNLVTFTASGSDPEDIHEMLLAAVEVYPETLSYIAGPTQFTAFKDMGVPKYPVNAPAALSGQILESVRAGIKAFLAGLFLIMLYGLTIRVVTSEEDMRMMLNAPYLGALPAAVIKKRSSRNKKQLLITNEQVPYGFIESVRTVRTRMEREAGKEKMRSILVTSTVPGEGKTTTAINLALSLAQKGRKVLLIDGDMRNPSIAPILGIDPSITGLSEVLQGKADVKKLVRYDEETGLYFLSSGAVTKDSTELLSSKNMKELLNHVREYADYVIIDTPPVMVLGDSMALGRYTDGCLFVVKYDFARQHMILDAMSQLAEHGKIIGTVLNGDRNGSTGGRGYGRYGKYGKYGSYGKYSKYGTYGSYGKK